MTRVSKVDPNLYQVDLVAGLFGGFLVIWMTMSGDADFASDGVEPPLFAKLSLQYQHTNGARFSIVDADAQRSGCLTKPIADMIGVGFSPGGVRCLSAEYEPLSDLRRTSDFINTKCNNDPTKSIYYFTTTDIVLPDYLTPYLTNTNGVISNLVQPGVVCRDKYISPIIEQYYLFDEERLAELVGEVFTINLINFEVIPTVYMEQSSGDLKITFPESRQSAADVSTVTASMCLIRDGMEVQCFVAPIQSLTGDKLVLVRRE